MLLPSKRTQGTLLKRYKRFLADIELGNKEIITVHCPNSGSMLGCSTPGSPVVLSWSDNPKRKYPWTLELVHTGDTWTGVNTARTNKLVYEALEAGIITEFGRIENIVSEVKVSERSRLDFFLETDQGPSYLEVKNCSLAKDGLALFPDAVTGRGTKHLKELMRLSQKKYGTAVLFCVQREDVTAFTPAQVIDPVYADTLAMAKKSGVQIIAYRAQVSPEAITVTTKLPVYLPGDK